MADFTLQYMKDHKIPVTRENYVELNWVGRYDGSKPLPAELEAELPEELKKS